MNSLRRVSLLVSVTALANEGGHVIVAESGADCQDHRDRTEQVEWNGLPTFPNVHRHVRQVDPP